MSEVMSALAFFGALAQLEERLLCTQNVVGSTPSCSTTIEKHQSREPYFRKEVWLSMFNNTQLSMKQKIKEALQHGHKNMGLSEEVFERVAASVETFITDDEGVKAYAESESVLALLKSFQSEADKARAAAQAKLKAEQPKNEPSEPKPEAPEADPKQEQLNLAEVVAAELAKALAPLRQDFDNFKAETTQKGALAALDELKSTWDYAKGYPSECADAYEQTIELYEAVGKKWNAEELKAKFTEKFNKAVGKKGVDTSKPFKGDGGKTVKTDFSDHVKMLKAQGVDLGK